MPLYVIGGCGKVRKSGGIIGRGIADGLSALIGKGGAGAVLFGLILLSVYIFHGLEMMASLRKRNAYKEQMEEEYGRFVQEETDYREPSYRVIQNADGSRQLLRETRLLCRQ